MRNVILYRASNLHSIMLLVLRLFGAVFLNISRRYATSAFRQSQSSPLYPHTHHLTGRISSTSLHAANDPSFVRARVFIDPTTPPRPQLDIRRNFTVTHPQLHSIRTIRLYCLSSSTLKPSTCTTTVRNPGVTKPLLPSPRRQVHKPTLETQLTLYPRVQAPNAAPLSVRAPRRVDLAVAYASPPVHASCLRSEHSHDTDLPCLNHRCRKPPR